MRIGTPMRRATFLALLVPSALAAQFDPGLPRVRKATPTTREITPRDLMTRIYIFADDSMGGRRVGTPDNARANAYIERELRRLGLQPAGVNGSFFQDVPIATRTPSVSLRVGADNFVLGEDFVPVDVRRPLRDIDGRQVIYGGSASDPGSFISEERARGKIVLINGVSSLGPMPQLKNAAGVIVTGADTYFDQIRRVLSRPRAGLKSNDTTVTPALIVIPVAAVPRVLGIPLANARPGQLGFTVNGRIQFAEIPAPAQNVVAIIPGRDAKLRGQYVAVGSHNDHIGVRSAGPLDHDSLRVWNTVASRIVSKRTGRPPSSPGAGLTPDERASIRVNVDSLRKIRPPRLDSINNGADDDASGSMGMLELAEYFVKAKIAPRRSLLFVWHTGEESGLDGSEYFTENPTVPLDSIVAQLNIDMIGRGSREDLAGGGPNYLQLLGSRRLSSQLGDLVERVNVERKFNFRFDYQYDSAGNPLRYYCRSDHWNYARWGIPVTFFSTGDHPDYHQVTDEPQYINYPHLAHVTSFVGAVMEGIANLDARPVIDKPRPTPYGACIQ